MENERLENEQKESGQAELEQTKSVQIGSVQTENIQTESAQAENEQTEDGQTESEQVETDPFKLFIAELASRLDGKVEESLGVLILQVEGSKIREALTEVKDFSQAPCDFLHDLGGLDLGESLAVVYQLSSLRGPQLLRVKAMIDRENPVLDSVTDIWPGANYLEREAFDMFGIEFRGHPELKRIYMGDDFEGYPLRKDYVTKPIEVRNIMRVYKEGE